MLIGPKWADWARRWKGAGAIRSLADAFLLERYEPSPPPYPLPLGAAPVVGRVHVRASALLLDVLARSLDDPSDELVEQDLQELGLLDNCRSALGERRRQQ